MSEINEQTLLTLIEKMGEQNKEAIAAGIAAAIQEVNKPKPKTDQEQAEIEQANQNRMDTSEQVKAKKTQERWFQEFGCSHEHSKQAGGGTHCVHVRDNDFPASPGYIFCQNCSGKFRPDDPQSRKLDPSAIFNTAKFNELFQECAQAQGEMLG